MEMPELNQASRLFLEEDLTDSDSDQKRYDEVDIETFANIMREGEDATKANVGVGYNKTMTAKRVAKEIEITWNMRRYNKHRTVQGLITSLSHFVPQRFELDLTHRLTFASATSYTDMDGETVDVSTGDALSLVNAAHTLKFSSTTYRNRVSGDPVFSEGALESAENLGKTETRSNFNDKRVLKFNYIVTGDDPNTCNAVKRHLNSTASPDGAHSGVLNVNRAKYEHIELSYLATTATGANDSTKRRWWFLVSANGSATNSFQAYRGIFEAPHMNPMPAAGNNGEDAHNDNWTFGTRGSQGICILSGKGCIGSLPTS